MGIVLLLEKVVVVDVLALVSDVLVLVVQIRPGEPSNIASLSALEVGHTPQSVCANNAAPENMACMLVTLETSQ